MSAESIQGEISFIHHERDYCTIDYELNGKKKTINGSISTQQQDKLIKEKIIKKRHRFHVGDVVSFIVVRSERGDKQVADCIQYLYNNALDNLLNKAKSQNEFVGYLKKVDEDYFVKETGSYIFFDLKLSPWEVKPSGDTLNEPVFFELREIDNPAKTYATLRRSRFIPQYYEAERLSKSKTKIAAQVYNVSPHAVYLNLVTDKVRGKLTTDKFVNRTIPKVGELVDVVISHLSPLRVVVDPV